MTKKIVFGFVVATAAVLVASGSASRPVDLTDSPALRTAIARMECCDVPPPVCPPICDPPEQGARAVSRR